MEHLKKMKYMNNNNFLTTYLKIIKIFKYIKTLIFLGIIN